MAQDDVRNVYKEIPNRLVIRTEDVWQTQTEIGVKGYSETLLRVVANFTNSGIPEGCNARGMAGKSKRGEVACQIFTVINLETRTILHAGFRSRGCIGMTASASQMCTMIEGLTIEAALRITPNDIIQALDGLPPDKKECATFAVEATHAMVGDFLLSEGGLDLQNEIAPCDENSIACIMCEHCSLRDLRVQHMFAV